MNRPIHSYCYVARSPQPQPLSTTHQVRSSSSSRKTSTHKGTLQRANQIKPSTIGIPKSPRQSSQPQLPELVAIDLPQIALTQQDRPKLFNWRNFGAFCGVAGKKKVSLTGCTCGEEKCPHAKIWTEGSRATDTAAYLGLRSVGVPAKDEAQVGKDVSRTYGDSPTFGRNPAFREMLR